MGRNIRQLFVQTFIACIVLSVALIPVSLVHAAAPVGADKTVSLMVGQTYTFTGPADFGFSDPEGDQLQSITITSLPTGGTLAFAGTAVTLNQEIPASQLSQLSYTAQNTTGTYNFTFSVRDTSKQTRISMGSFENPALGSMMVGDSMTYSYPFTTVPPTQNQIAPPELGGWNLFIQTSGGNYYTPYTTYIHQNGFPWSADTTFGQYYAYEGKLWQRISGLQPGATYQVSGYAIVNDPNTTFTLSASADDAYWSNGYVLASQTPTQLVPDAKLDGSVDGLSASWRQKTLSFVAPASGSAVISVLKFNSGGGGAPCNWDNITVTRTQNSDGSTVVDTSTQSYVMTLAVTDTVTPPTTTPTPPPAAQLANTGVDIMTIVSAALTMIVAAAAALRYATARTHTES